LALQRVTGSALKELRMNGDTTAELQAQVLAAMRAQQEAYLEAAKAWRDALAKGQSLPQWPSPEGIDALPSASELAQVSYAFAAKVLSEQSAFLEALSKAMSEPREER